MLVLALEARPLLAKADSVLSRVLAASFPLSLQRFAPEALRAIFCGRLCIAILFHRASNNRRGVHEAVLLLRRFRKDVFQVQRHAHLSTENLKIH